MEEMIMKYQTNAKQNLKQQSIVGVSDICNNNINVDQIYPNKKELLTKLL